ncbi:MAG: type II secretion system protein [Candidatus Buchananbacteria bacterium]|nr:type II secretion system protein [Candidatus Buchananbacteria bacterium]
MNKQRGLTLIELMVVILIIVFIATVATIAVKNARTKTRDTKRIYDIQQYAKAIRLYAQENQGQYPLENGYLGRNDAVNTDLSKYLPNLPSDPSDKGGTTGSDYYYYYVANNICNGITHPTVHVQNIETSQADFNNNGCPEGLGGSENGYANAADYLIVID